MMLASDASPFWRAVELLNSLISLSYLAKSFPAKWQLIRDKLDQLSSGLTAAASGDATDEIPSIAGLLQAIPTAAEEAQLLAGRCGERSYSGGKLQLRSDLDVLLSKLDVLVKGLSEIQGSGALAYSSRAIILSRPGPGASREDMRFYAKDLFSRLRIGGSEVRARALTVLNEILRDEERYLRIVVVEVDDGVSLLVSLLESGDLRIQEEAADAVSVISGHGCYKGALVNAGAISPLVRVLETGTRSGKENAALCLMRLTENSDNGWSVSAHGGVSVLIKICGDPGSGRDLIASACEVIKNLSGVGEIKRFMVDGGLVQVLVKLSRSEEEATRIQAIEFLNSLAFEEEGVKRIAVREGLVESLVEILDLHSPCSSKAREVALRSIQASCFSSPDSVKHLIGAGFLDRSLLLLRNGEVSVQESALKAVSNLCKVSEETTKAIGDAGFMPELVRLLEARSFEVREIAAVALCSMVSVQRNRRRFIEEEHSVNRVLQLLDPKEEKPVANKPLLSLLVSLTGCSSGRRRLASSVFLKNLQKLAEADVPDAKKIVKKLSGNRFRTILSGIWS